jgi:hypothetical protein
MLLAEEEERIELENKIAERKAEKKESRKEKRKKLWIK